MNNKNSNCGSGPIRDIPVPHGLDDEEIASALERIVKALRQRHADDLQAIWDAHDPGDLKA